VKAIESDGPTVENVLGLHKQVWNVGLLCITGGMFPNKEHC